MDPTPRLRHELRDTHAAESQSELATASSAGAFGTPEELLRHDRLGTPVPAEVEQRLESSLQSEPQTPSAGPWWRRWLGGFKSS